MKATQVLLFLVVIAASCGNLISASPDNNTTNTANTANTANNTCINTIAQLSTPETSCTPFSSIFNSTSSNSTFNLDVFLGGTLDVVCKNPKCSSTQVANVQQEFQSGCAAYMNGNYMYVILGINAFLKYYTPITEAGCLTNSTGGYCLVETLDNVKGAFEQLGTPNIGSIDRLISELPKDVVCTDCNKRIFNVLDLGQKNFSSEVSQSDVDNIKDTLTQKCGDSFLGGSSSSTNSNSTSSSDSTNSATSIAFHSGQLLYVAGAALLSILFSVFVPQM